MRALALALLLLTLPAAAEQHVVLLDVSGSMRDRGYAFRMEDGATAWGPEIPDFLARLLATDDRWFQPQNPVTLIPFSDRATDAKEGRAPIGPVPLSEAPTLLEALPAPGAGATDMDRCLDLDREASRDTTVLTWLITDNENNLAGNQSDRKFYQRLRDSPDYSHVYFFPLSLTGSEGDALVMYLLVKTQDKGAWVDDLAAAVAEKTGFEGVLFRPLYSDPGRPVLDFGKELQVDTGDDQERVTQEGGTTVLHFDEGQPLAGQVKFRIRSNLKGWQISKATMEEAEVSLKVPPGYRDSPGDTKLSRTITPKQLTIGPGKESADLFLFNLESTDAQPLVLERTFEQWLSDPFASHLDDIEGRIKLRAVLHLAQEGVEQGDLRPALSPEVAERVQHVPNLMEIEEFMVHQSDLGEGGEDPNVRTIRFERRLLVQTRANPLGGWLVLGLGLGGLALAAASAWALLLWKARYTLEGPGQEEEFTLGYLFGSYLVCAPNGVELCTLRQRFGGLSVVPVPEVEVNGSPDPAPLRWEGPEARLEVKPDGKEPLYYTVVRSQKASAGGASDREDVSL
ncbi:MAG: hypothetical protein AB1758_08105 [Candidatus Eremiobacterota bacterium]